MRIGLVIDYFDPRRGGAEQWTFQHAQRLLARGHEVHVVAQDAGPAAQRLPIVLHRLGKIRSRIHRGEAAEGVLRRLALDVIHDMGLGWYCDIFESHDGSRVGQWERKLHMLPPWARPWKRLMIRLLPRYGEFRKLMQRQLSDPERIVVALSKMVADDFLRYHAVRPEQIRLIYNGVDTERFSPANRDRFREPVRAQHDLGKDEVVFVFVGHDFRRKGLATAIRALGRLTAGRHDAHLLVVGGKRFGPYQRLAQRCGAADRVTFVGPVDDPVPYYAAADAFVLPSFYDPCSLSVSEAAASGLPSVTSRFNGAGELLTEGIDGYVLPDPADDAAMADRMQRLLDPGLRHQMGAMAHRLALQYTLDRNCDETVAVYHEIARVRRCAA